MSNKLATGIDIGTHFIRVVVAERLPKGKRILGTTLARSKGLRHGYIINHQEATNSIDTAIRQTEKNLNIRIKKAEVAVGGVGLDSHITNGTAVISRADSEITYLDTEKAVKISEEALQEPIARNNKILHTIPLLYKIDGKETPTQPLGLKGVKLEVKTLLITCLSQHLDDLVSAVEETGVEVNSLVASPLASAMINLAKTQKVAGVALADIGAETLSLAVYENNMPISLKVFPIGSSDITNDIALGLKIPLEEAEKIKVDGALNAQYKDKQVKEIIDARVIDMLEIIDKQLKKLKKNELLPAGVVITGGGAGIANIEELVKKELKLPSEKAELSIPTGKGVLRDPAWSVAYGMANFGVTNSNNIEEGLNVMVRKSKDTLLSWVQKFLP